jgi:hypothetical protein
MRLKAIPRHADVALSFALLLTLFLFFPRLPFAWSGFPHPPSPSPKLLDPAMRDNDLAYDRPIIFFEEDAQILVFYFNGDIIHRGHKLTNDKAVVRALQEILSLSPCRHEERKEPQHRSIRDRYRINK